MNPKKNIVLIGMRGSGKTHVGKMLGLKLGKKIIELDKVLEKKSRRTIAEYVKNFGWQAFRDLEEIIVHEESQKNNAILATGGGVVEREENITQLKKYGILIWLYAPFDILYKRIGSDNKRPLLTEAKTMKEDLEQMTQKREKLYKSAADVIIDTQGKTVEKITFEIIEKLKNYD